MKKLIKILLMAALIALSIALSIATAPIKTTWEDYIDPDYSNEYHEPSFVIPMEGI